VEGNKSRAKIDAVIFYLLSMVSVNPWASTGNIKWKVPEINNL
jgi:hypothetical protein